MWQKWSLKSMLLNDQLPIMIIISSNGLPAVLPKGLYTGFCGNVHVRMPAMNFCC